MNPVFQKCMSRTKKPTYRSGFEGRYAKHLKASGIKAKHEPIKLPYVLQKNYIPDFVLEDGYIHEAKGRFTAVDRAKMIAVRDANPGIKIKMIFQRDNYLTKSKAMRYSGWCERNGFEYEVVGDLH